MARTSKNNNVNKKYQTALYVRLSREDGDDKIESNSITNQKEMLQNYINKHNDEFEIYEIYSDENFTGTNFDRPNFSRMLKDIESGIIKCVIVKDLSRFGRDYIETGRYLERVFPQYNVRFIALNDNIDSFKQAYNMLLPISNIFNQQYAVDISKKVQSAFKVKQQKGQFIGAFASYAYIKDPNDNNKLIIDEYASQIVKRIYQMYLEGMGQLKIARVLNEEGILCPSEYKKQSGLNYTNSHKIDNTNYWTYSTIRNILCNQIYVGDMVQNKTVRTMKGRARCRPKDEWIIVKNTHEAIIERQTWNNVQNLINRNTRQLDFNQNISIFAGFLKCPDCGRAMAKNKRGGVIYYICGSYKRYGTHVCTSHTITHYKLEEMVTQYINLAIISVTNLRNMAESISQKNKNRINVKSEIEKNQIALNKVSNLKKGIYEDYKEGLLTKEEYTQYKLDYDNNEKFYKEKINILQNQETENENSIFKNEWLVKFLNTKQIDKLDRAILAEFINYIEIGEDKKININWSCNSEVKELLNIAI